MELPVLKTSHAKKKSCPVILRPRATRLGPQPSSPRRFRFQVPVPLKLPQHLHRKSFLRPSKDLLWSLHRGPIMLPQVPTHRTGPTPYLASFTEENPLLPLFAHKSRSTSLPAHKTRSTPLHALSIDRQLQRRASRTHYVVVILTPILFLT